jgi:hypothetical protein
MEIKQIIPNSRFCDDDGSMCPFYHIEDDGSCYCSNPELWIVDGEALLETYEVLDIPIVEIDDMEFRPKPKVCLEKYPGV